MRDTPIDLSIYQQVATLYRMHHRRLPGSQATKRLRKKHTTRLTRWWVNQASFIHVQTAGDDDFPSWYSCYSWYVLDATGEPVPVSHVRDMEEFWQSDRHVGNTFVNDVQISTVFLGLDHRFEPHGLPVLWETMIFSGEHDGEQERYTSREDAIAGHQRWVEEVSEPDDSFEAFSAKVDRLVDEVLHHEEPHA